MMRPHNAWMDEAYHLLGVSEKKGAGSNARILQWARDLKITYTNDEIAWCGLFVAHCMQQAAVRAQERFPSNVLGARAWLDFGVPVSQPFFGCVLVFWRGTVKGIYGHVGFYVGENSTHYFVLGGNQGDAVSIVRIPKTRLLGARWPRSAVVPEKKYRPSDLQAALSNGNEA